MADDIPVKLIIEEPEGDNQTMEFSQGTIKIGRGRPGKARKGVDVQLSDPSVARVAAVLHVRGLEDVYIMDMGSGGTRIDGKKVGSRGKVKSGTKVLIGDTQITVYIGDDASATYSAEFDNALLDDAVEEGGEVVHANVSFESLDGTSFPDDEPLVAGMSGDTGAQEALSVSVSSASWEAPGEDTPPEPMPAATPAAATGPQPSFGGGGGFDAQAAPPTQGSFGLPPASEDNPNVPQGFGINPVHQTPLGYFGPVGPPAPGLPEQMSGGNLAMLLDVADRLGKEIWYLQMPPW